MFYSKLTGGFYDSATHGDNIPSDVVEITTEQWSALLDGQAQGKVIVSDDNRVPTLVDPQAVALNYAEKRQADYPDFRDYLDGVVKGDQAQIDAYIAACQAVKAKYPKEAK